MLNKLVINVVSDPYRVKSTATVKELYLVENLMPENARYFESPPWVKFNVAEVSVTPAPIEVFEEGYTRNLFIDNIMLDIDNYEYISPYHYYEVQSLSPETEYTISVRGDINLDLLPRPAIGNWVLSVNNEKTNPFPANAIIDIRDNRIDVGTVTINSSSDGKLYLVAYQPAMFFPEISKMIQLEKGENPNSTWTPAWEDLPIEDKPVSFIETSGGTNMVKYLITVVRPSTKGVEYQFGGKIKNVGDSNLVINSNLNASYEVDINETIDINFVVIGNGVTNLGYQFRTKKISDNLSFYAYRPAVYEVHGNTDVYMFDGEVEVNILNEGDNVVPKITTDAEITIKFKDHTFTVNAGTHILTGLVLEYGDNIVTISGEDGTSVKFEYTERVI
ncbi:hypothetical protein E4P35_11425 [Thiopseudomonas sp. 4R-3cl]|nr:hypothetical protein E4P35_11425 [Thiopseudomonas sp. 4R-3cl]